MFAGVFIIIGVKFGCRCLGILLEKFKSIGVGFGDVLEVRRFRGKFSVVVVIRIMRKLEGGKKGFVIEEGELRKEGYSKW